MSTEPSQDLDIPRHKLEIPKGYKPNTAELRVLNPKEFVFAAEYIKTLKATPSARTAGFSESVATKNSYSWVVGFHRKSQKPHLRYYIAKKLQDARDKELKILERAASQHAINANWVLNESKNIYDKAAGHEPMSHKVSIDDNGEEIEEPVYKVDLSNALKALDQVAKNKLVDAYNNTIEIGADSTLGNLLSNINTTTKPPSLIEGDYKDISHGDDDQLPDLEDSKP